MSVDLSVLLQSGYAAFCNDQLQQGLFLVNYATKLAERYEISSGLSSLDAAICLDRGNLRKENEDCVLALHGKLPGTGKAFGLFVICDGMGGHVHAQKASSMAIQTILDFVFPLLMQKGASSNDWGRMLVKGVEQANRILFLHNQRQASHSLSSIPVAHTKRTPQINTMGTTVTAALLVDTTAYITNVGDSRAYLYAPETGLARITRDHSVVAELLAQRVITEDDLYRHPRRNQIMRYLGQHATVEVDLFSVSLPKNAILLLCSDGLWEMTRDPAIASILQLNWASTGYMAHELLELAREGGALDNISLVVVQSEGRVRRNDISSLTTLRNPLSQVQALLAEIAG